VAVGGVLSMLGVHHMYSVELGVVRLAGAGQPAFLAGFALVGIYAGLLEIVRRGGSVEFLLLAVNFCILVLTGARAPLALAAVGVLVAVAVLFLGDLSFIRVVDLARLGQGGNLSNRGLVWPMFEAAIAGSPWVGWGVGAGKMIVPLGTGISTLIGTNAAHNEYLRIGAEGGGLGLLLLVSCMGLWVYHGSKRLPRAERWLMRLVFVAFAVHSATDNTLIATTSSVLFIWASAVFSGAAEPHEEAL
jgi:hypothetical protein